MMEFTAEMIAGFLGGEIVGNKEAKVHTVSSIEEGKAGSLSYLTNPNYEAYIYTTGASVVLVNRTFEPAQPLSATLIKVDDAGACVVDLDERRRKRLRGFERAVDQHDRRSGSVNIGFVVGIGKIAERAGLAFLDRRYGVYFRLFVADDFTAQESGDHFGCEFHHKIIIGIC